MKKLKSLEEDWNKIITHLHQPDNLERASFCFLRKNQKKPDKFYVREVIIPTEQDYKEQSEVTVTLKPEWLVSLINEYKKSEAEGFMEIHNHSTVKTGMFSGIDNNNYPDFRDDILKRNKNGFFVRMVMGGDEDGFTCLFSDPQTKKEIEINQIVIIGRNRLKKLTNSKYHKCKEKIDKKFIRNTEWMGSKSQQDISEITLGCIGAGGSMNPFILAAIRAGFKKFIIVDFDKVGNENQNRLLGITPKDNGKFKVTCLKREMLRFDPKLEITIFKKKFQDSKVIKALQEADVLVAGVDNEATRMGLQIFSTKNILPLFDMASGIYLDNSHKKVESKGAQVRVFIPEDACLVCQGLNPDNVHTETWMAARKAAGYVMNTNESPGSVITLNMTIASLTLSLVIDYVTGMNKIPIHLGYDELKYTLRERKFQSRPSCNICGESGIVGLGYEEIPRGKDLLVPDLEHLLED